jgi:glycosyltransferase involved in cell wall biosynthesis
MKKIKVLFIVSEFYQAGTQRFAFEVDRALNKNLFDVEILSILPLKNNIRLKDYYFKKHIDLGTKIRFFDKVNVLLKPTIIQRIKKKLFSINLPDEHQPIIDFFNTYDCISIMGEYNLKHVDKYIKGRNKGKILVHIHNSKFQKPDLYSDYMKDDIFHFVSSFGEDQIKWELNEFKRYKHTYFNLNLKLENNFVKVDYTKKNTPKIGIFTRLTFTKPLDPFIYTFKCLQNKIHSAELHFFGSGDPKQEGIYRYVEQLQLESSVFFRGHQDNILKTAVEEELDLVWLHGYHGIPGGWAGFDIATAKIPQLFWNFGAAPGSEMHPFFPMFNDPEKLADFSFNILNNPNEAKIIAVQQYEYINANYNIDNNLHHIEKLYIEISSNKI